MILFSLFIEFCFYLKIGDQYYPQRLQNTLNYLSRSNEPSQDLSWWEDNSLSIRQLYKDLNLDDAESKSEVILNNNIPTKYKPLAQSLFIKPTDLNGLGDDNAFIVGCSSAYGYGVRYDSTFGYLLERYTHGHKKVINAAQVGWSSIQLVPVVKRIVDSYHPKTIILFMSNNEWKNWADQKPSASVVAFWKITSFCTKSYALSYILYHAFMLKPGKRVEQAIKLSAYQAYNNDYINSYKYSLENPITDYRDFSFDDWIKTKNRYIQNFSSNLAEMVNYCKSHNVEVVLMTMPYNYKLSPSWASPQPMYHNPVNKEIISRFTKEADSLIDLKIYHYAEVLIDSAIKIEPTISTLHYMKGVVLEKQTRHIEAELAYARSKEYMVGDKGGILSIDRCIREVAKKTGCGLVDVQQVFDEYNHSNGKYYNQFLIEDDCHPNELGHQIIAKELYQYFLKN